MDGPNGAGRTFFSFFSSLRFFFSSFRRFFSMCVHKGYGAMVVCRGKSQSGGRR